jgi:hypothetical protein
MGFSRDILNFAMYNLKNLGTGFKTPGKKIARRKIPGQG